MYAATAYPYAKTRARFRSPEFYRADALQGHWALLSSSEKFVTNVYFFTASSRCFCEGALQQRVVPQDDGRPYRNSWPCRKKSHHSRFFSASRCAAPQRSSFVADYFRIRIWDRISCDTQPAPLRFPPRMWARGAPRGAPLFLQEGRKPLYARFDFMSPKTGRVLLSTLFDAPQDRLPSNSISPLLKTLMATKRKLEGIFGAGMVRLSLDNYEASVFWALVLFRPFIYRERKMSVYDVLLEENARVLQKLNVGLVYDAEHGFLILDWIEGREGVLSGLETCPSWETILKHASKRAQRDVSIEFWKRCAESHSFVVPEWTLRKMNYLSDRVWFRPNLTYRDVTVLDTRGVEVIRLEGEGKGALNEAKLMVAKNVKFVHHYTEDKREFKQAYQRQKQAKIPEEERKRRQAERVLRQRLRRKGIEIAGSRKNWRRKEFETENRRWYLASRIVGMLPKLLGKGIKGKYPPLMSPETSNDRLRFVLDAYVNGELVKPKWKRVESLLKELSELLKDPRVPREFGEWLIWRDQGKHIPAYLAKRRNP